MPIPDDPGDAHTWSRRSMLLSSIGLAASIPLLKWSEVIAAAEAAGNSTTPVFLTVAEAADIEAIASQIIPTDATPGAREMGVVNFIDRTLASFFAPLAPRFRQELAAFQQACRERFADSASFAALSADHQIEWLHAIERTPFFETMRLLTILGTLSMPEYGGNRDGLGWRLIGFADEHVFTPPFGYYDRDYPGFAMPEHAPP